MFPDFSKLSEVVPKIEQFIALVVAKVEAIENEQKRQGAILDELYNLEFRDVKQPGENDHD